MSLKENIEAIKEELSAEEKFLESVIKTESFYKKNKKFIIGVGLAVFIGVVGSIGYNYIKEQKAKASNEIYLSLLSGNGNKTALEAELKSKNQKLYALYKVQTALKSNDLQSLEKLKPTLKDPILKDLVDYQIASLSGKGLLKYAGQGDVVMKDFAYLTAGYIELEKGNISKADEILNFISPTSPLYRVVQSLKHYQK